MTDFAPFPVAEQFPSLNGPAQAEKRTRGPRRAIVTDPANLGAAAALAEAPKKRMGRPKKAAEPVQQAPALSGLFQILAGLQSSDVVPLTSCYDILAALPPADRVRVLGFLNRVWG